MPRVITLNLPENRGRGVLIRLAGNEGACLEFFNLKENAYRRIQALSNVLNGETGDAPMPWLSVNEMAALYVHVAEVMPEDFTIPRYPEEDPAITVLDVLSKLYAKTLFPQPWQASYMTRPYHMTWAGARSHFGRPGQRERKPADAEALPE